MKPALLLLALVTVPQAGEPTLRGKLLETIPAAHTVRVRQIAFSPDGKYLAAASTKSIHVWDLARRAVVTHLEVKDGPHALAFSADGKSLAVAAGQTVTVHEVPGGKKTATLELKQTPSALAFGPDAKQLAAGREYDIEVWDLVRGVLLHKLKNALDRRNRLTYRPAEKEWVAESPYGVQRWDLQGKVLGVAKFSGTLGGNVWPFAFSRDGKRAAFALGPVRLWDAQGGEGKKEVAPNNQDGSQVENLALSADGKVLAIGRRNHTITLIDAASGNKLSVIKTREVQRGDNVEHVTLAFAPDGKTLAGCFREHIGLWDVATGAAVDVLRNNPGHAYSLAFSPDGKHFAAAYRYTIDLWETATRSHRKALFTGPDTNEFFSGVSFSPNGKTFAVGIDNRAKVNLFDATEFGEIASLSPNHNVLSVALSPDGKTLALGDFDSVRLWDVAGKKQAASFVCAPGVRFAAFDRGGAVLATGHISPGKNWIFAVWDVKSGRTLADFSLMEKDEPLFGKGEITQQYLALAFSPDGKTVAAAGATGIVKLWDAATGKRVGAIKAHDSRVRTLAFSPDGKLLATGGVDKLVKLWDVATRKEVGVLRGHVGPVTAVAFSPTQPLVVVAAGGITETGGVGGFNGAPPSELYVWELSPAKK
jgi:WD40 repeat protein